MAKLVVEKQLAQNSRELLNVVERDQDGKPIYRYLPSVPSKCLQLAESRGYIQEFSRGIIFHISHDNFPDGAITFGRAFADPVACKAVALLNKLLDAAAVAKVGGTRAACVAITLLMPLRHMC